MVEGTRVAGSAALSLVDGGDTAAGGVGRCSRRCWAAGLRSSDPGGWGSRLSGRGNGRCAGSASSPAAWPWEWSPAQLEAWIGAGGWAHSTVRSYQGAVAAFLDYVCDPRYGWVGECEQQLGVRPVQICHERNTAVHVADYEGRPARRPLTRAELQAFFDAADDRVEQVVAAGRKGWLAAFRDATLFKVCYAFGLRRREVVMLDVADFTANPAAPALGGLGVCQVRYGKAMRGVSAAAPGGGRGDAVGGRGPRRST